MAKVLQLRRGDTAKNNNFTGLPGELSFDTESKTLRVHDGETLGGFELFRVGFETGENGTFDINTVPDEFWENLFGRFSEYGELRMMESELYPIVDAPFMDAFFNITGTVKLAYVKLVCEARDAGYSVGEEVNSFGIGTRTSPAPNIIKGENGTTIRLMIGGEKFWVSNIFEYTTMQINPDSWKVKFTILY